MRFVIGYGVIAMVFQGGGSNGGTLYRPAPGLPRRSLLDVMRVTEPGTQLFGVFENDCSFYRSVGDQLELFHGELEKLLSGLTLGKLARL